MNSFKHHKAVFAVALFAVVMLAGFSAVGIGESLNAEGDLSPVAEVPTQSPTNDDDLTKDEIIELVKADLASRLGIDGRKIGLVSVDATIWDDASFGCPEEGEMAAQVLIPGYRVLLAIGGPAEISQYDYRTDFHGHVRLCE